VILVVNDLMSIIWQLTESIHMQANHCDVTAVSSQFWF